MIYIIIESYYTKSEPIISEPKFIPRNKISYVIFEFLKGQVIESKEKYFDVYITIFTSFLDAKIYREKLIA